jgi:hypothetical protein
MNAFVALCGDTQQPPGNDVWACGNAVLLALYLACADALYPGKPYETRTLVRCI